MRSSIPLPGSRWPHDMVITVQDDTQELLNLLWLREAWQLLPDGADLPPALSSPPAPVDGSLRAAAPIASWQAAWPGSWAAALKHAGRTPDPHLLDRLHDPGTGLEERARLLRELIGPSWRDDVGPEALTPAAEQWRSALLDRRLHAPRALDEQPEHAAVDALVPAWRSGLTTIVEIPCTGEFTRRIGEHCLLVTAETRADRERYGAALAGFR